MLNQKKVEIFSRKFRKSLAKQFLEVAYRKQKYKEIKRKQRYEE
jgi:hypothetical protein